MREAVGLAKGGGVTTMPGIPVTGPGVLGGGAHGQTLLGRVAEGSGAAYSGELVWPGGSEAALPGVGPLTRTSTGDGRSSGGASVGAHARFGDAPKVATATAATMIHAADAATPIRPACRRGRVLPGTGVATATGARTATGAASGASRAAPHVGIPPSIGAAPDVRVGRARPASRSVSARRSAYRSVARPTWPPARPGAMTIGPWPVVLNSRNGAHFRQAPSARFQQSAQQAEPQIGQSR